MSLKSKVASALKLNGKSIEDYAKSIGTSKQSYYVKLRNESLTVRDLVKVANYVGMKVVLEGEHGKVDITIDDFELSTDKRNKNGGNLPTIKSKVATKKVEAPDLTDFINSL